LSSIAYNETVSGQSAPEKEPWNPAGFYWFKHQKPLKRGLALERTDLKRVRCIAEKNSIDEVINDAPQTKIRLSRH
jgi:hypothetical protein